MSTTVTCFSSRISGRFAPIRCPMRGTRAISRRMNADSVPASTVMDVGKTRAAGQATPDLAMLRRIRVLLTSEPPKGWKLDEG